MIIFGGNDGQEHYKDYIVFDIAKGLIVERKEIKGNNKYFEADWRFGLKVDQESILFLSKLNLRYKLRKINRSTGNTSMLYKIKYDNM